MTQTVEAASSKGPSALSLQSLPNPALTTDLVTITGQLSSGGQRLARQQVQVQYSTDKNDWRSIASVTTGSDGGFSTSWRPVSEGQFYLRAVFAGNKKYSSSVSSIISQQVVPSSGGDPTPQSKGLFFDPTVILSHLPTPSFADLVKAGFTLVGTQASRWFDTHDWDGIAPWIRAAHSAGLKVFVMIQAEPGTAAGFLETAVSIGADVIELDELLARYNTNETQLRSLIEAGLGLNPNLSFIVTEYYSWAVMNAYSWTSNYPSVRVATDNYGDKTIIDLGIQQAEIYGKQALAWLIFAQDDQPFNCLLYLDDWLAYVKQKDVDVLFYWIDPAGDWQTNWAKVQTF